MKPQGLRKECQESSGSMIWTMICFPFNIWLWMATMPFRILFYLLKFDFKEWAESIDKERAEHERKIAELEILREEKAQRELENKAKVERETILKRGREERERREVEVQYKEREERKREREFDQHKMYTQDKGRAKQLEVPLQVFSERVAKDSWMTPDILNTLSDTQVREVQRTVLTPFEPLESVLPRRESTLKPMESERLKNKEAERAQLEVAAKKKSKKKSKAKKNKQAQIVPVTITEPEIVFDAVMQELLDTFMQMPEVFAVEAPPKPMKAAKKIVPVKIHEEKAVSSIPINYEDKDEKKEKKTKEALKEEEKPTRASQTLPKEGLSLSPRLSPPAEEISESAPREDTLKGKESLKRDEPEKKKKRRGQPFNWERTIGTEIPNKFSVV